LKYVISLQKSKLIISQDYPRPLSYYTMLLEDLIRGAFFQMIKIYVASEFVTTYLESSK